MMKKAELSMSVIVMATIALLVLVVVSYIFISGSGKANDGLLSCDARGGTCTKDACDSKTEITTAWTCEDAQKENPCCIEKDSFFG